MEVKEILVDGYFYNVTDFVARHPGGSIIEYYTKSCEDATHAIQQFHHRSAKRVTAIMSTLKKRPALDSEIQLDAATLKKNRALSVDFNKLHLELETEGFFEPSYTHTILRMAELLLMGAVGYSLLQWQHIGATVIGTFLIGLMMGRFAWIQHEGGHRSLSGNPKLDRVFHSITAGLGSGVSSRWWDRGHNRHHAMPQRLHHDVDLDTMPLLAYNAKIVRNATAGKGFMVQNQIYLFALLDTFVGAFLWKFYLHPRYVWKHKHYLDIASMMFHYVFAYHVGFWPYVVAMWTGANYLFINFALNHTFMPVTTEPTHWVEYALAHTADVEPRPWCDWWMGYLNYQIEHHLFPTMPQFRHPLVKDRVRALAEKHNIPYVVHSYVGALQKTFKNLAAVAEELKNK